MSVVRVARRQDPPLVVYRLNSKRQIVAEQSNIKLQVDTILSKIKDIERGSDAAAFRWGKLVDYYSKISRKQSELQKMADEHRTLIGLARRSNAMETERRIYTARRILIQLNENLQIAYDLAMATINNAAMAESRARGEEWIY